MIGRIGHERWPRRKPGFHEVILACTFLAFPAFPDDDPPRDVRPLQELFAEVHDEFSGRVLEVELDDEDDSWVYEVKLLTSQGHVLKLEYDAFDLTLLEVKGRRDTSD